MDTYKEKAAVKLIHKSIQTDAHKKEEIDTKKRPHLSPNYEDTRTKVSRMAKRAEPKVVEEQDESEESFTSLLLSRNKPKVAEDSFKKPKLVLNKRNEDDTCPSLKINVN